jgi:hypothetical protein
MDTYDAWKTANPYEGDAKCADCSDDGCPACDPDRFCGECLADMNNGACAHALAVDSDNSRYEWEAAE